MKLDEQIEKLTRPLTAEEISYHAASDFEDGRIAAACEAMPIIRDLQAENKRLEEEIAESGGEIVDMMQEDHVRQAVAGRAMDENKRLREALETIEVLMLGDDPVTLEEAEFVLSEIDIALGRKDHALKGQ